MDFTLIADLKDYLTVERHTPGHLCLKVDLAVRSHPAAARLKESASSPAIKSTRFNLFSRTLTVDYDSNVLPYDSLNKLFSCSCPEQCKVLAQQLAL